jgi:hypothetical protein
MRARVSHLRACALQECAALQSDLGAGKAALAAIARRQLIAGAFPYQHLF